MNKDLRSMTVKEIKAYMQEHMIKIAGAYKMRKEELIVAIEKAIAKEEIFDPDKTYIFSKDRYLERIEKVNGKDLRNSLVNNNEFMDWLNRLDGQEVKQSSTVFNRVYVDDEDDTFSRDVCVEKPEEVKLDRTTRDNINALNSLLQKVEKKVKESKKEAAITGLDLALDMCDEIYENLTDAKKYKLMSVKDIEKTRASINQMEERIKLNKAKLEQAHTCKFKLGGADEDTSRWDESDAEYFEMDLRYFDSFIDELDAKYDDRLDRIDDYRYTVSNLSDEELGELERLFNELDNDMDYCWISYDFIEVEAA